MFTSPRGLCACLALCLLLTGVWSVAAPPAALCAETAQHLAIVNATAEDLLNLGVHSGRQTHFIRLDMPPGGSDAVENPGGVADLRLDTGLALWCFKAVPLGRARSLTFTGGETIVLELDAGKGETRRLAGVAQSLLPGPEAGPVCALDRFRPGMTMKDVCALLDPNPSRDDNDAVLTSLGFAGMVWAARLSPGQAQGQGKTGTARGPDRLDHMELRRRLDKAHVEKLLHALYAQGYAPWQAELPGLDMNFTEMTDTDQTRQKDILRQVLEYFMASGKGEATLMLAPAALLPRLADGDAPKVDVQLFTLTLRPLSKNLIVDVAAYQGGEGGR